MAQLRDVLCYCRDHCNGDLKQCADGLCKCMHVFCVCSLLGSAYTLCQGSACPFEHNGQRIIRPRVVRDWLLLWNVGTGQLTFAQMLL
ncbi:hypothetical protein DUNSADRAFT_7570 [Dunaliella salina]|uniref:Uncharacterized protein n=1 Tax=Dunaliella salina TaxID=3046 RepID=A0ABQ7GL51_DUNSA|nr:hypothetical protein DUNSADRAFT_7570 [Dunaliella salina]|eukprot:KAF5835338.1 hypothetical protein DUNSADRAFT_7570 [Dunaliella salina]